MIIIPIDELIFFRGVAQPPSSCCWEMFGNSLRNHLDLETIEGLAMALNKFEAG